VLVDADANGAATQYSSAGLLPVSSERLPIEDWRHMEGWIQRVLAIQVDFVVVDAPPRLDDVTKAIMGICDLVVIPWRSADDVGLVAAVEIVELLRLVRSSRSDACGCENRGGKRCWRRTQQARGKGSAGDSSKRGIGRRSRGGPVDWRLRV